MFMNDKSTGHIDDPFLLKMILPAEVDQSLVEKWRLLESNAMEFNAYLSPDFVIPALEYLFGSKDVLIMLVLKKDGPAEKLVGLGIFRNKKGNLNFPFPHLEAYRSPQAFLTGILADKKYHEQVFANIMHFFNKNRWKWFGLKFKYLPLTGTTFFALCDKGKQYHISWHQEVQAQRSCIFTDNVFRENPTYAVHKKLKKDIRRCFNNLEKLGNIEWNLYKGNEISDEMIDRFLKLENTGWKGESKTSILSAPHRKKFFLKMIGLFRGKNAVFFTELSVNGKVVASNCNLISGDNGFAYKVAWDPEYAKYSPGNLNEYEFLSRFNSLNLEIKSLDSGATEGSFIDRFWPNRISIGEGMFLFNRVSRAIIPVTILLNRLEKYLNNNYPRIRGLLHGR